MALAAVGKGRHPSLASRLGRTRGVASRASSDRARSGTRGINNYTDSIMQLSRTNQLAASILKSVSPLDGDLSKIDALAADVDSSVGGIQKNASSINTSATSINGSAATILGDVTNINRQAVDQ
jgi:hypothetical protein